MSVKRVLKKNDVFFKKVPGKLISEFKVSSVPFSKTDAEFACQMLDPVGFAGNSPIYVPCVPSTPLHVEIFDTVSQNIPNILQSPLLKCPAENSCL